MKETFTKRLLACFFLSLAATSCIANNNDEAHENVHEPAATIGWLHGNCLAIKNQNLAINTELLIIELSQPPTKTQATISGTTKNPEKCYPLFEDRRHPNIQNGFSFYTIETKIPIDLAIGFVTKDTKLDKLPVSSFTQCATSEGIIYSIWEGEVYQSKKIRSEYYYLGYDMEASCPDQRFQ